MKNFESLFDQSLPGFTLFQGVFEKFGDKNLFRIVWELVTSCCGSLLILKALKPWQRIRRSLKSRQKKQNAGDCWSLGPLTSAFLTKRKNVNNFAHCPTFPQQQIECWLASIEEGHHIMLWRHPVAACTESRGIPAGQMLVYYSDPQGKFLFLLVLYCNQCYQIWKENEHMHIQKGADESFCILQFVVLQSSNQLLTKSEMMTHSPLTDRGNY